MMRNALEARAFWARVDRNGPTRCWLWISYCYGNGYGRFIYKGGARLAHRVSYVMRKGPIPPGLQLDHLCRVRACVNPHHLEAVTPGENSQRGLCKGATWMRGEKGGNSKLKEKDVLAIRNDKRACREIAAEYGMSRSGIRNVKVRSTWRWLE